MRSVKLGAAIVLAALLIVPILPTPALASGTPAGMATVLFDFGDGNWRWTETALSAPRPITDVTTAAAASQLMLAVFRMGIYDLELESVNLISVPIDRSMLWNAWEWNATLSAWAPVYTIQGRTVEPSTILAWRFAAYGGPAPDPTPLMREPWLSYRGGRPISGMAGTAGPSVGGVRWAVNLSAGAIDATPVVAGGRAFFVTGGAYDWNGGAWLTPPAVVALDAVTGRELWRRGFEGQYAFEIATPAYSGGRLFVPTAKGHVMALEAANGSVTWDVAVNASGGVAASGLPGDPVLVGTSDSGLLLLDRGTGAVIWRAPLAGSVYQAAPTVIDGRAYIGTEAGNVHCLDLRTRSELWNASVGGRVRSSPLVDGGRVLVTSSVYSGYSAVDGALTCLDLAGTVLWNATTGPTGSSPTLLGALVVVGSSGGVRAFRLDGTPAWAHSASGPVSSSPVVAGDRAYVLTNVNDDVMEQYSSVVAIAPNGSAAWSKELAPHQWALSSVAVVDGWAYTASDSGWAYCLGDAPVIAHFTTASRNGEVTFTDASNQSAASVESWTWDFGDGSTASGAKAVHSYERSGHYNITLTVVDEFGRVASRSIELAVKVPPPAEGPMPGPGPAIALLALATAAVASRRAWR